MCLLDVLWIGQEICNHSVLMYFLFRHENICNEYECSLQTPRRCASIMCTQTCFLGVIVGEKISILSSAMLAMAFSPYNIGNEEEFGC